MKTRLFTCLALAACATTAQAQNAPTGYDGRPYCREFTQQVIIGGHRQTSYGTSCMQPDGSWQIVQDSANASIPEDLPPQAIPYSPVYAPVAAPVYYEPYYPAYNPGPVFSFGLGYEGGHRGGYGGGYHGGHGGWRH